MLPRADSFRTDNAGWVVRRQRRAEDKNVDLETSRRDSQRIDTRHGSDRALRLGRRFTQGHIDEDSLIQGESRIG